MITKMTKCLTPNNYECALLMRANKLYVLPKELETVLSANESKKNYNTEDNFKYNVNILQHYNKAAHIFQLDLRMRDKYKYSKAVVLQQAEQIEHNAREGNG